MAGMAGAGGGGGTLDADGDGEVMGAVVGVVMLVGVDLRFRRKGGLG